MTITQELRIFLGYSLAEMQTFKQEGRITDRLYRHYLTVWQWGTWRANYAHDRYYQRMGSDAYWRRISRVKALVGRINAVALPEPGHIPFHVGALNP